MSASDSIRLGRLTCEFVREQRMYFEPSYPFVDVAIEETWGEDIVHLDEKDAIELATWLLRRFGYEVTTDG